MTEKHNIKDLVVQTLKEKPGLTKEELVTEIETLTGVPVTTASLRLAELGLDGKIRREYVERTVEKMVETKQKTQVFYLV